MNADQPEPKIIVDEDYKARVKAEKEAAARAEAAKAATPGTQQTGGQEPSPAGAKELPPASFATLVNQLAVQALVALGAIPTEPAMQPDLPQARYLIDTLQVLQDKTRGNLSEREAQFLEHTLHELRMAYVSVHK
ncbi:MAG: DUF1844 domain-containing protein [Pirellulales bacterium]|nr:DUF1844 domain-containing protein [Pirellulales bacterium]